MGWLTDFFKSLFKPEPIKYCDELAYECALKLQQKYPDTKVTTVSGVVVGKDGKVLFENGKLQFHRMAATIKLDGEWQFWEDRQGALTKVDGPEWWRPSTDVGVVRYRAGMTHHHNA